MTDDASEDDVRYLLHLLEVTGKSPGALAAAAGIAGSTLTRRLNDKGYKFVLSTPTLKKLEQTSGINYAAFISGTTSPPLSGGRLVPVTTGESAPVVVTGQVAAGVFREVDDFDQSSPEKVWEPIDRQFPSARRMAFDVEGDSMNALKPRPIMPGDRLICVSFEDVADRVKVRDGLVVVVERTRDGGHTREWSVKQVELYEDRIDFCPRSTNPKHKPIVVKRDALADEGVKVEIIGLVRAVRNEFPL